MKTKVLILFGLMFTCFVVPQSLAQEMNIAALSVNEERFSCPMHAEVLANKSGKCSKCGMALERITGAISDDFILKTDMLPKRIKAGQKATIQFSVFNPKTLAPVKEFILQHEKLFHLFIVSNDLKHFAHIHPTQQKDGSFSIETIFPEAGQYHVYSDIFPAGGLPQIIHQSVTTAGFSGEANTSRPKIKADEANEKVIEGIGFTLDTAPLKLIAGQQTLLRYKLSDAKTGQAVTDWEPYLGAWGHTLILSEDCTDFIHSHPLEMKSDNSSPEKLSNPAAIFFEANFSRPGNYRIWSQVQRAGKIITVTFDVTVATPQ